MSRIVGFLVATLCLAPLSSSSALDDEPELKLKAPRVTFLRPTMPNQQRRNSVTIRITGQLLNLDKAEDLEEYYCLEEIWEWDDDTDSEYGPDCDPYEPGAEIKTNFSASHQYRYPGTYTVWLRLERNGEHILSDSVNVQIRN